MECEFAVRARRYRWITITLLLAAIYNISWGAFVILSPLTLFKWAGMAAPNYPEIWQCVGMVVGVYGAGYAIAAFNPIRHWPIVFVGLLGKVLGPIGFLRAALNGKLPWIAGWLNVTNDLIWWVPFALILWKAYSSSRMSRQSARRGGSLPMQSI